MPDASQEEDLKIRRTRSLKHFDDDSTFLWAVSFTDLMLVLLSFFVLFFSFGDLNVLPEKKTAATPKVAEINPTIKTLYDKLANQKLSTRSLQNNELVIDFSNNLYKSGGFTVNPELQKELNEVIGHLISYQKEVEFVFVGHTDDVPFTSTKSIISSNLVLSDLRASHAAEWAIKQGLIPANVSTKGYGEYARGTRSLSIHVISKQKKSGDNR